MQTPNSQLEHHATIHRIVRWVNRAVHMIGLGVLVSVLSFGVVMASGVTGRIDVVTNHTISALSSHSVQFTLFGANTWVAGETMEIDFHEDESRFAINGAAVLAADLSVNDGTARTIFDVNVGAADCTGSVGADDVAVGINNTTGVVTFLACPSFVASGAGATVILRIGSAAGGTDRITNPAVAGNYLIDITSAAGDCGGPGDACSIGLIVVTTNQVVVTAVVGDGGGGGGGGGSGDVTPPIVSGIFVNNITATSGTVNWNTNEVSNSTVHYGVTPSYGNSAVVPDLTTVHSVGLTNLTEATTYHFQVCSMDTSLNVGCSGDNTFTTLDLTPPVISNVVVSAITETSAVITWTTNEPTNSFVDFDTVVGPPYSSTTSDGAVVTSHTVTLTGLTPFTTYHFRVRSADAGGNESFTADDSFTTVDTTAPVITNVAATNVTTSSATIVWTTNEVANSSVDFGLTASYGSIATDAGMVVSHAVPIVGLTENTTYHFRVNSTDAAGNSSSSIDFTFSTAVPAAPVISALTVTNITQTSAVVQWTTSTDASSVVEFGLTSALGLTAGEVNLVRIHSVQLVGLAPGSIYHFVASSTDAFNQQVQSVDQTFETLQDTTPPAVVLDLDAVPGDGEVQLLFQIPSDPDVAGVRIVRSTSGFPLTPIDGVVVFDGVGNVFTDTGLVNGENYFYSAFVFDGNGNFSGRVSVSAIPNGVPLPPLVCSDSDGGTQFDTKGEVTTQNGVFEDRCIDGVTVEEESCSNGLRQIDSHNCGTGFVCDEGRCLAESLVPTPVVAVCGNGICDVNESTLSCLVDCPVVPQIPEVEVPPTTVSGEEKLNASDLFIYVVGKTIRLAMDNAEVEVYPGLTLVVVIPDVAIPRPIRTAIVNFLGRAFAMTETNSYEVVLPVPLTLVPQSLVAVVNYIDGSTDSASMTINIRPRPRVVDTNGVPVAGAEVELLREVSGEFVTWSAAPFEQVNPVQSANDGSFGFVVPEGLYRIRVSKSGYLTNLIGAFNQKPGIITGDITLIHLPEPDLLSQIDFVGEVARQTVENIRNDEQLRDQAESVATPAIVGVAVINAVAVGAATASLAPFLASLLSFLTQPFVLVGWRRRKKWGVIYNSLTKLPIDLAIVRLLDAKTGRLVKTMVTDRNGRYFFIVEAGVYKISVIKSGFVYPTTLMTDVKVDDKYTDVYHGEPIALAESGTITMNIPVDPVVVDKTVKQLRWEKFGKLVNRWVSILAIVVSVVVAVLFPGYLTIAMVVVNLLLFFVTRRLAAWRQIKNWGVVRDESGKPVGQVLARVFDTRFNKLLETQVTDRQGRYSFLVGNNTYVVTYDKTGYAEIQRGPVSPALFGKNGESQKLIADDVKLRRV